MKIYFTSSAATVDYHWAPFEKSIYVYSNDFQWLITSRGTGLNAKINNDWEYNMESRLYPASNEFNTPILEWCADIKRGR